MELTFVIEKFALIGILVGISLVVAMYTTLAERKIASFMQDRVGPNRAGPFGILQPLADGIKLIMKEEITPTASNKFLFFLGPCIAMFTAMLGSAVIPWGESLQIGDVRVELQVTDLNVAILYMFGVVSIGVYGIMIGGWASNNKFSLLSAVRAASQNISYEIAMGISIVAIIMMTGSMSLSEIAAQQRGMNWNVFYQPVAFLIFWICAFAECNRSPFDLPECESELNGGYHQEYSSMKLGFYLFAEYINMFVSSAVMATLFLGAYNFPFMDELAAMGVSQNLITLMGVGAMFTKVFFFLFVFIWVRWTTPRFRYDQLMTLGWNYLMPLAIANLLVTGLVMYFTAA